MSRSSMIQDLIFDILLCLPVKSLLRFRCLSKEFRDEIDSTAFTKAHQNQSFKNKTRHKLVTYSTLDQKIYAADLDSRIFNDNDILISGGAFKFCGSSNGLILLSSRDRSTLWLCNPFTRKCKKLPDCPGSSDYLYGNDNAFGFGYDGVGDDYKVVQIILSRLKPGQMWVFSLAYNSWRNLEHEQHRFNSNANAVFAYGALHWTSYFVARDLDIPTGVHQVIASFDLSKEVFVNMIPSFPLRLCEPLDCNFLDAVGGSLVFGLPFYQSAYVVVKSGQQFAWTKLSNININPSRFNHNVKPFRFWEKYLENGNNMLHNLVPYGPDFRSQLNETTLESVEALRMVGTDGMHVLFTEFYRERDGIFCWESLVSPHAKRS